MKQKTTLLFLPKNEHYDLLLLYMTYLIKSSGFRVLYLGTNISTENLKTVSIAKKPDYFFSYITPKHPFKIQDFAHFLNEHLSESKLFVAGCKDGLQQEESLPNVRFIHYKDIATVIKEVA
ncbi:MAG: hypothetical protein M3342_16440 [Bacteroidota bacterium]|nr:hypothetical protein [Flavisolibacter sp.]MDQ3845576.1 hypothetical protein [Bacteroidota bacterium]MBD0296166.1 hypothetical protein [Flavisolibacter sp.]MBD0349643.1 hypothetical protein [Flavisolibacter sp.]MBD0365257.1 hypothetical protein [Flavisolibacter sp.]